MFNEPVVWGARDAEKLKDNVHDINQKWKERRQKIRADRKKGEDEGQTEKLKKLLAGPTTELLKEFGKSRKRSGVLEAFEADGSTQQMDAYREQLDREREKTLARGKNHKKRRIMDLDGDNYWDPVLGIVNKAEDPKDSPTGPVRLSAFFNHDSDDGKAGSQSDDGKTKNVKKDSKKKKKKSKKKKDDKKKEKEKKKHKSSKNEVDSA